MIFFGDNNGPIESSINWRIVWGSCHCVWPACVWALAMGKETLPGFRWPSHWPGGGDHCTGWRSFSPVSHATRPGTREKLSWEPRMGKRAPARVRVWRLSYCSLNFVLKIGLKSWTFSVRLVRFWLANEENLIPQVAHHKKKWMTPVCSASRAAQNSSSYNS